MKKLFLFTDGSVDVQSKIGYGACLLLSDLELPEDELKQHVQVVRFENTSSTKLELQILLWALAKLKDNNQKVRVYTDSQNIVGLPGRRERLEQNKYKSKKNELIKNHELYQEFYRLTDRLNCEFKKVQGHQQTRKKDQIHKLFTWVDRASRRALRGDYR